MKRARSVHLALALIVIAADWVLSSYAFGYGVRGLAAVALWWAGSAAVPLLAADAFPSWGRVAVSLAWTARFLAVVVPLLAALAAGTIIALRATGNAVPYAPSVVSSLDEVPAYLLHGVVLAPLIEELIYRGVVQPRLRAAIGVRLMVAVSGPLFFGLHWIYSTAAFNHLFAGWILAWARERTGSLLAPTLLHALGNAVLFVSDVLWLRYPDAFRAILGA